MKFLDSTYTQRADLIRYDEEGMLSFIKDFNLGEVLKDPSSSENIRLKNNDIIRIYPKTVFQKETF